MTDGQHLELIRYTIGIGFARYKKTLLIDTMYVLSEYIKNNDTYTCIMQDLA